MENLHDEENKGTIWIYRGWRKLAGACFSPTIDFSMQASNFCTEFLNKQGFCTKTQGTIQGTIQKVQDRRKKRII